jgi:uncharacterized protein with PQ loop repeat
MPLDWGLKSVDVNDTIQEIVGIGALLLSLIYRLPQIYDIYKSKKADDISNLMLIIQNLSYVAYISYGVFIHDWIYIASSVISFLQNFVIFLMKRNYRIAETEMISTV